MIDGALLERYGNMTADEKVEVLGQVLDLDEPLPEKVAAFYAILRPRRAPAMMARMREQFTPLLRGGLASP